MTRLTATHAPARETRTFCSLVPLRSQPPWPDESGNTLAVRRLWSTKQGLSQQCGHRSPSPRSLWQIKMPLLLEHKMKQNHTISHHARTHEKLIFQVNVTRFPTSTSYRREGRCQSCWIAALLLHRCEAHRHGCWSWSYFFDRWTANTTDLRASQHFRPKKQKIASRILALSCIVHVTCFRAGIPCSQQAYPSTQSVAPWKLNPYPNHGASRPWSLCWGIPIQVIKHGDILSMGNHCWGSGILISGSKP